MNANEIETAIEVLKANERVQNEINKKLLDLIKELKDENDRINKRIDVFSRALGATVIQKVHQCF